jgi:hypothetical protein
MYSDRYDIEMMNIRASVNKILEEGDIKKEIRDLNEYIYLFLLSKYSRNVRKTEETIINILLTLETYSKDSQQFQLFQDFMNYVFSPDDISCFLLIRSLIEKELNVQIVSINKKNILDMGKIALTKKQTRRVFEHFMVDESPALIEKSFNKFIQTNMRVSRRYDDRCSTVN